MKPRKNLHCKHSVIANLRQGSGCLSLETSAFLVLSNFVHTFYEYEPWSTIIARAKHFRCRMNTGMLSVCKL